jgi:hypothetical protein
MPGSEHGTTLEVNWESRYEQRGTGDPEYRLERRASLRITGIYLPQHPQP